MPESDGARGYSRHAAHAEGGGREMDGAGGQETSASLGVLGGDPNVRRSHFEG
jgi:hypothetical protein